MFITKAYSPNSGRFKRVPHDNSVSKRDVGKAPSKPAQERVTSHSEAQNDSRTQEESIQGGKHRSPHPPGLSIHSPIELDDDIDNEDHEHVSKSSVVSPGGRLEELDASSDVGDVQNPILSPVASTRHRWELPFPRRRYPPGHKAKFYPIPEDDPQDLEWADDVDAAYYDDPEFTGFSAGRRQLPSFISAKDILQDTEYNDDDDAYSKYSQDDDNEDEIYGASEHLAPPPPASIPIYKPDRLNYDIGGDDDSIEESSRIPRKEDPRVDDRFPLPLLGDLTHPYID